MTDHWKTQRGDEWWYASRQIEAQGSLSGAFPSSIEIDFDAEKSCLNEQTLYAFLCETSIRFHSSQIWIMKKNRIYNLLMILKVKNLITLKLNQNPLYDNMVITNVVLPQIGMNKFFCQNCKVSILEATYKNNLGMCAPCYFKAADDKELQHKLSIPGCPKCEGSNLIGFSWRVALRKTDKLFSKYTKYIIPTKRCKYGKRYHCVICDDIWWLNEDGFINAIPADKLELFEKWNSDKYTLKFAHLRELLKIKSIGSYRSSSQNPVYSFPCAVHTINGDYFEKVLIVFSKQPPLYKSSELVFFADEIKNIEMSRYALPFEVRQATYNAPEIRISFSPTVVKSSNGKLFTLNELQHFFDFQGIKGEEISLTQSENLDYSKAIYYKEDSIRYCFVDLTILQQIIMKLLFFQSFLGK